MEFLRKILLIIVAIILIGICSHTAFGQLNGSIQTIGNPDGSTINQAYGEYSALKAMRLPSTLFAYRNYDSTGNIAFVGGAIMINKGAGIGWQPLSGGGTVTSISQGYGISNTPNPIIGTGTIKVDTATLFPAIRATIRSGSGTVTSITEGYGLINTPNPITATGTQVIDTATLFAAVRATIPPGGVTSFNTRTGAVSLTSGDVTTALGFNPVTDARTLTINGTTFDLTANRTFSVGTVTSIATSTGLLGGTITGTGTLQIDSSVVAKWDDTLAGNRFLVTPTYLSSFGFGTGTVMSVTAGTGLSGGTITTTGTISMPNTGTAGTYGSATQVPVLTTDAQGRITGVTNTTITGVLPSQSTHANQFLQTNGTSASWQYPMIIGQPVTGATSADIPFIDGSGNLGHNNSGINWDNVGDFTMSPSNAGLGGNGVSGFGNYTYLGDFANHTSGTLLSIDATKEYINLFGKTNLIDFTSGDTAFLNTKNLTGNVIIKFPNRNITLDSLTTATQTSNGYLKGLSGLLTFNATIPASDITGLTTGTVTNVSGTANQIGVATGTTTPVISIVTNPIFPGAPTIVSPGNSTQDILTTDATQTETNKTITSSTNTLGGVTAGFGSDAKGDMYQNGGSSNIITRTPIGTTGQVWTVVSGLGAWATGSGGAGTSTPTASTNTQWGLHKELYAQQYGEGWVTNVTAAATITLTVDSAKIHYATGTAVETYVLPVTSTCPNPASGYTTIYVFNDSSTADLTILSSGSNLVMTIHSGGSGYLMLKSIGNTSAIDWQPLSVPRTSSAAIANTVLQTDASDNAALGTLTANTIQGNGGTNTTIIGGTGTTDQIIFSPTTGNQTTGLAYTWLGGNNGASILMTMGFGGALSLLGNSITGTAAAGTTFSFLGNLNTNTGNTVNPAYKYTNSIFNGSSTLQIGTAWTYTVAGTSTAGFIPFQLNVFENSNGSGTKKLMQLNAGSGGVTEEFSVTNGGVGFFNGGLTSLGLTITSGGSISCGVGGITAIGTMSTATVVTQSSFNVVDKQTAVNQTATTYLPSGVTNNAIRTGFGGVNFTPSAGNSGGSVVFGTGTSGSGLFTIPSSGTSALFANVEILPPIINTGTGTCTNGVTLYIDGAPALVSGLTNAWSMYVRAGKSFFGDAIMLANPQTTVSGSTSGSAIFSQPEQGSSYKKVIIFCNALLGTASYTFPTAFTNTPAVVTTNQVAGGIATSLSTSAVTLTGTTTTGYLIIEGY